MEVGDHMVGQDEFYLIVGEHYHLGDSLLVLEDGDHEVDLGVLSTRVSELTFGRPGRYLH